MKETIRSTRQFSNRNLATLAGECGRETGSGLRLEQEEAEDLPPPNTKRWVARRKAAVVVAVRAGMIPMNEALHCYQLTEKEFLSWRRTFERLGHCGLRQPSFSDIVSSDARKWTLFDVENGGVFAGIRCWFHKKATQVTFLLFATSQNGLNHLTIAMRECNRRFVKFLFRPAHPLTLEVEPFVQQSEPRSKCGGSRFLDSAIS